MTTSPPLVRLSQVTKCYHTQTVLNSIDLELRPGDHFSLQGPSGSGKSTLLHLLAALDRPTSGQIWVDGHDLLSLDDVQSAHYRNRFVGLIFQFHYLLPSLNCLDNILLPMRIGRSHLSREASDEICARVERLVDQLGVRAQLKKFPYQLSGGEQQRINIVRALSMRPRLLLCDEPTGNLDSKNSRLVIELLSQVIAEMDVTSIIVTHDDRVANSFGTKLRLEDGRLVNGRL